MLMATMEPLPLVGPATHLQQQMLLHPKSHHCLIWKDYATSLIVSSGLRKGVVMRSRISYDTGNYVRLHSQGGTHHGYGFSSSQSDGLADTGLGTSLDRSAIADRPSLRATGSSLRACPSRACSTGKKGDL